MKIWSSLDLAICNDFKQCRQISGFGHRMKVLGNGLEPMNGAWSGQMPLSTPS